MNLLDEGIDRYLDNPVVSEVDSYISARPTALGAYYFTSADYGLGGIALRRLKVARFSDANDPFELLGVRLRDRQVRKAVKDFKKECNKTTGLLCFSQRLDQTDPLELLR
jgi:hypothetical protein